MARTVGSHSKSRPSGEARAQAWQSMRMMQRFTTADLMTTGSINSDNARKYVRRLADAGYLRVAKAGVSGRPGSRTLWLLIRDTGPVPPIVWADGRVYDGNTKITHSKEETACKN